MTIPRSEAFVDSSRIEAVTGLTYGINRPAKYGGNPVLTGTPSAYNHHIVYVNAIDVDGDIRLYYNWHNQAWTYAGMAVANSTNGVNFTHQNLGLFTDPMSGTTNNAVIMQSDHKTLDHVNYHPSLAATPFVMVGTWIPVVGGGQNIWVSADGVNFTVAKEFTFAGTHEPWCIVRRPDGRWLMYLQGRTAGNLRTVEYMLSDTTDLGGSWAGPTTILTPADTTYEYYSFAAWTDGEVMYSVMCIFDARNYYDPAGVPTDTKDRQFKFELWTSRADDGIAWTQVHSGWLWSGTDAGALDTSPGEWDYGCIIVGGQMVRVGNDWRYYYGGAREQHHPYPAGAEGTLPHTQREAGFATVGYRRIGKLSGTGTVTLDPITPGVAGELTINSTGTVKVELLDITTGAVLTGYSQTDCDTIPADTYEHTVTWNGSAVTPTNYKVKVYATSATVYYVEATTTPQTWDVELVVGATSQDWDAVLLTNGAGSGSIGARDGVDNGVAQLVGA